MNPYRLKQPITVGLKAVANTLAGTAEHMQEERRRYILGGNLIIQYSMLLNTDYFRKIHILLLKSPYYTHLVKKYCKLLAEKMEKYDDNVLRDVQANIDKVDSITDNIRVAAKPVMERLANEYNNLYNNDILAQVDAYNTMVLLLGKGEMEIEAKAKKKYCIQRKVAMFSCIDTHKLSTKISEELHKALKIHTAKLNITILTEIDKELEDIVYSTIHQTYEAKEVQV